MQQQGAGARTKQKAVSSIAWMSPVSPKVSVVLLKSTQPQHARHCSSQPPPAFIKTFNLLTTSNWYFTLPHNYLDKTDLHNRPVASHRKVPKNTHSSITQMQQSNPPPRTTYHELKKAQNPHRRNPPAWWRTQRRTAHLGSLFSAQKDGRRQNPWDTKPLPSNRPEIRF